MGGIAIIGWGSLIWDLDDLAPRVAGDWAMGAGPALPLEFSRISAKRRMGLAVCIDAEAGVPCATHWIRSTRATVLRAAVDLALRERTVPGRIGYVALPGSAAAAGLAEAEHLRQARADAVAATIDVWCRSAGVEAAVWTDLASNFRALRGGPFSAEAGRAYLADLTGGSRAEAVRYIQAAPASTDTPLRRLLAETDWWRDAAAALGGPAGR
ncbi:MAG: hypothetical protein AAF677_10150 [Pseudomonadota bacterium]